MLDFSLVGSGGYVAPRHISAIKDSGNRLIAALDHQNNATNALHDFFPDAQFFTDFETYKAFHKTHPPDYVSVCTPNHQHFEYIKWALESGAHAVCEKPIVTDTDLLIPLMELEKETGKKVYTILQLRYLKQVIDLKKKVANSNHRYHIDLTYLSRRDENYFKSWKADPSKSGGLITNIGIHLFDLVIWIFGSVKNAHVFERETDHATGFLELEKADVRWILDVKGDLVSKMGISTFRELKLNGIPVRLDNGLEHLHRISYDEIIAGNGWGIKDAIPSIKLCNGLNKQKISELDINKISNSLTGLL